MATEIQRIVLQGIEAGLAVSQEELVGSMQLPEGSDADDVATANEMARQAMEIANPKAVYCVAPIEEKREKSVVVAGVELTSPLVRSNLDHTERIVPFVVTCGTELEEWSQRFDDLLEQYWADGIKRYYLGKMQAWFSQYIHKRYFTGADMSAMSPGSLPVWPLRQQRPLFELIGDVKGLIGVELTDSFLMLPSKSSSGFFFSAQSHYENCRYCPILDCPNRRAKFQAENAALGQAESV